MDNPKHLIDGMLDRVSEIEWWNRSMTGLTDEKYFANGKEFVKTGLLPVKGPYIEHIVRPALSDKTIGDLEAELKLHPALVKSIKANVFNKLKRAEEGRLYYHQEEALRTLTREREGDVIITAPTSGGKTETFLFPVLQYCLENRDSPGLKAIFIYPMKTLATDQFNRLLRYVGEINKHLDKKVNIAIWDGDTPEGVTSADSQWRGCQPYDRPHQRGLQCPEPGCRDDMNLTSDEILQCSSCGYTASWAKTTRRSIRDASEKIDILITNPESLETMLQMPSLQRLLGNKFGNPPLKYILFDEAHIWRGASGSTISLLIRRLKNIYSQKGIQFILASATIQNKEGFARSLLGESHAKITPIQFKAEERIYPEAAYRFNRLYPTNFEELVQTVYIIRSITDSRSEIESTYPHLIGALRTSQELNMITMAGDQLSLAEIANRMVETVPALSRDDIEKNIGSIAKDLLDDPSFVEVWRDHVLSNCPEITILSRGAPGGLPVNHLLEKDLIDLVIKHWGGKEAPTEENARLVLTTCLNLGRTAQVLSDKYHVFLGPTSHIYYCAQCKWLSLQERCTQCDKPAQEIVFCKDCNTPLLSPMRFESETEEAGDETDEGGVIADNTYKTILPGGSCSHRPLSPSVWYPSFVSYMLSYLCREASSKKALVFSDSRRTANTITRLLQDNDHSLVAEQLFVRHLLQKEGYTAKLGEIRELQNKQLRKYYTEYLWDSADAPDLKEFVRDFDNQVIFPKSFLNNSKHLFTGAIIAPQKVLELAESNQDLAIGFMVFSKLYNDFGISFTEKKVEFSGITPDKLLQKVSRSINHWQLEEVQRMVYSWVTRFLKGGLLGTYQKEELEAVIDGSQVSDAVKKELRSYFDTQRKKITTPSEGILPGKSTSLLRPLNMRSLDEMSLTLVPMVSICTSCTTTLPAQTGGLHCPFCGHETIAVNRIKGDTVGAGHVSPDDTWDIDHWGREIVDIASKHKDDREVPHIFPGVHTGQARQEIRGILEKGFKSNPPKVNVISATPTLELGVDIGDLDVIIQVGIPPTLTNYIQRSGRAGRVRGRPSFIFTVLRNEHPIDEYHFEHLEEYLQELRPIRIPNPEDLDNVVASQMVGETLSYISRYVDENVYSAISTVPKEYEQADDIAKIAKICAARLCFLAADNKDPRALTNSLRPHLNEIFHREDIYQSLFIDQSHPLNLMTSANKFFDRIKDVSNESMARYRYTVDWLSEMALFRSYRGTGHDIPVVKPSTALSGKTLLMMQETTRTLTENFPGPRNGSNGARFDYEGVSYKVTKVTANVPLGMVDVCHNDKCQQYMKAIRSSPGSSPCQACNKEMVKKEVLMPDQIIVENIRARGETYANVSIIPSLEEVFNRGPSKDFAIDCELLYGDVKITKVTTSYCSIGRSSKRAYTLSEVPAKVLVDNISSNPFDVADKPKGTNVEYGHIGTALETLGYCIRFKREDLSDLFDEKELLAAITSWGQAIRLASAITSEAELEDLEVAWALAEEGEDVIFFVYDTKPRGSGISKQVFQSILSGEKTFFSSLAETAGCKYCASYCSHCLLLPRTNPQDVANNLLDRHLVQRLIR